MASLAWDEGPVSGLDVTSTSVVVLGEATIPVSEHDGEMSDMLMFPVIPRLQRLTGSVE